MIPTARSPIKNAHIIYLFYGYSAKISHPYWISINRFVRIASAFDQVLFWGFHDAVQWWHNRESDTNRHLKRIPYPRHLPKMVLSDGIHSCQLHVVFPYQMFPFYKIRHIDMTAEDDSSGVKKQSSNLIFLMYILLTQIGHSYYYGRESQCQKTCLRVSCNRDSDTSRHRRNILRAILCRNHEIHKWG